MRQKNWTSEKWEVARGDDMDRVLSYIFPKGTTERRLKKALRHLYGGVQGFNVPAITRWLNS